MFGYFDYSNLNKIACDFADSYKSAQPFPHVVLENFADERKLIGVLGDFPSPDQLNWWSYDNHFEKKLAFDKVEQLPLSMKLILS